MNAIVVERLTKTFGELRAVDGIDLAIPRGEIFGLLGPNGAGKTTTLMMLCTLLKPTSGRALVNGFDVVGEAARVRSSIGMVFQDPSSDEVLTGYENLKLHALMYDVPWRSIDARIDEVLGLVDLVPRKHEVVKKYSGGMRRRMELARGLLHEPQILFLDEPTLGLDPQTREHIWQYVEALAKNTGMTIILTTHYMEEAERLCNRVAIIDSGKIAVLDSPENLRHSVGGDVVTIRGALDKMGELARLPFVRKVEQVDGHIKISVENSGRDLQKILAVTGEVEFVDVHSTNLNDVFLAYTGRAIREQSGDALLQMRTITRAQQGH